MNNQHINKYQAESMKLGATAFIETINKDSLEALNILNDIGGHQSSKVDTAILLELLPHKVGDIIWLSEEFTEHNGLKHLLNYRADGKDGILISGSENTQFDIDKFNWKPASEMQEHQSRFKGLLITDIQIKSVRDLTVKEIESVTSWDYSRWEISPSAPDCFRFDFFRWLQEQGIDYNENNLIAIYTFKKEK